MKPNTVFDCGVGDFPCSTDEEETLWIADCVSILSCIVTSAIFKYLIKSIMNIFTKNNQ